MTPISLLMAIIETKEVSLVMAFSRTFKSTKPFFCTGKNVILIDDVLYTGRTIKAALEAMAAFGRPTTVELLVLINRKYSRELPISANYVGKSVNSLASEKVIVELKESENKEDGVWLIQQ